MKLPLSGRALTAGAVAVATLMTGGAVAGAAPATAPRPLPRQPPHPTYR